MPSSAHFFPDDHTVTRRVRHLTSIQVCNLSPFPVRDTLAFALAQPSQFTSSGKFSDDLDITIGRRRARRISASSTTTRSIRWDDKTRSGESADKKPVAPPSHSPVTADAPTSPRRRNVAVGAVPLGTVRPSNRPRTLSTASFASSINESLHDVGQSSSTVMPSLLRDASQNGLERVIQSRLIETYVTVTIRQSPASLQSRTPSPSPDSFSEDRDPHDTLLSMPPRKLPASRRHAATKSMHVSSTSSSTLHSRSAVSQSQFPASYSKSMSMSLASQDFPSHLRGTTSPIHSHLPSGSTLPSPTYRSPVHRPSTNPSFSIDIRGEFGHLDGVDLSGDLLHIEVWGNFPSHEEETWTYPLPFGSPSLRKGKERDSYLFQSKQWRILKQWDVNLVNLLPLREESHLHQLPSNTLVLSLTPPSQRFYVPVTPHPEERRMSISRPASPSGYNSDPESDLRKARDVEVSSLRDQDRLLSASDPLDRWHAEDADELRQNSALSKHDGRVTANWQDLLKLTTLQTVILDTKRSLSDVLQVIDQLVVEHPTKALNREVSDRRACIREVEAEKGAVLDECQNLRDQIDLKHEAMRIRRRVLGEAEQTVKEEQQLFVAHATTLGTKRDALSTLRNQAPPLRSAALASLASIYPIELVSPPDLLFSILDVALPIPLGSTDPAPPISLPAFRDINEDTVATALGFAAHVVQLLAAYMNKNLIYPITYVGSRSLIKDGISAMVGPRMFPLFSKGVDTYRFEYAVFLLNKNIELLMADRDLRALDMRHTLPNLKNLLLTLTDPEGPPHQRLRPETMSQSDSGLHSPSTASSMLSEDDIAERNEEAQADSCTELPAETSTIASAGSTTPTNATTKKTRNFLDLGPLTGFLRSRYPSTSRTAGNVEADGEATAANGTEAQSSPSQDADLDDDDDRRTIRDTRSEHAEDKAETPIVREDVPTTNGTTQVAAGDAAAVEKAKSQLTAASLLSRGQVSV